MHDKVLSIIRETLVHENEIDHLTFDCRKGEVCLHISQPRADGGYPDHDLELHFTGIRELQLAPASPLPNYGGWLLGIECHREGDGYIAVIAVGVAGQPPSWTLRLAFTDLSYKRYSNDSAT
jgi:hypothetical protein